MRIFSYDVLENTENAEDHHLLLMMKTKMRKLHQGHPHQGHPHPVMNLSQTHPHQRSNLSRVQMRTDYPSNLKVINEKKKYEGGLIATYLIRFSETLHCCFLGKEAEDEPISFRVHNVLQ